jgi:cell division transport system permease protein
MKIRTARYIFKEGFLNAYRNRLMSLASIAIVMASLLIFGTFFLLAANLNSNLETLKEQPEMQVFCYPEMDEAQIANVEDAIKKDARIKEYVMVTKAEAFNKVKNEIFDGKEYLLEDLDESIMPVSFIIKLVNPEDNAAVVEKFKDMTEVENVTYASQAVEVIANITYWVPLISGVLLLALLVVSMFIISNTIKLTVFARRREINIMKYIGATDWFIRWPFIVEGVIIGVIGSAMAFALMWLGYDAVEQKSSLAFAGIGLSIVKLLKFNQVASVIMIIFGVTGAVVGAFGSFISIRKYLKV